MDVKDPVSLETENVHLVPDVGRVALVFVHLFLEEVIINVLAVVGHDANDLVVPGLLDRDHVLQLHQLCLEEHRVDVDLEVLVVDKLLKQVTDVARGVHADLGHEV